MIDFLKPFVKQAEREEKEQLKNPSKSFAAPDNTDGAREVESTLDPRLGAMAGFRGFTNDFENRIKDTCQLIKQYRGLSLIHEVDDAIQEIVDDAIVYEDGKEVVWLDLDSTTFSDAIKKRIEEEFDDVITLLHFRKRAHQLFRYWYIDSRMYFHKIINKDNTIKELRLLDPMKLELVRELHKEQQDGVDIITHVTEYYLYRGTTCENTLNISKPNQEIRIPKESIVSAFSGLTDRCSNNKNIIGYLHRAIKPANQLKMLEDAMVIYRLTRAPERRVFYVDVGSMPNRKAQQYVNNIMQGLKNRVVYDTSTGKVKNVNSNMSMLEDYYLPRREGSKGTEVSTLPAGQNLGDIDDVLYFNRKLYKAMHIPSSRASTEDNQGGISFGGGGEITRDELKFTKFIRRLQNRFETIISEPLKHQLLVKKIITEEEWDENFEKIYFVFNKDSYFEEQKDLEIFNARMAALQQASEYVGKYFSNKYIMRNILRLSDDEMEETTKDIDEEQNDPRFRNEDDDDTF